MLFKFIEAKYGDERNCLGYLHFIELMYDCRFTVDDMNELEQSYDFFAERAADMAFVQEGNLRGFNKLDKSKIFFGFIDTSRDEAYKAVTGLDKEKFYCPKERLYLVPLWMYVPEKT